MQIGSNYGAASVYSAGEWGDYGGGTAEAASDYSDAGYSDGYELDLSFDAASQLGG